MDTATTWSVDLDDRSPHRYWSIYLHTPTGKHRLDVGPFHHAAEGRRWGQRNLPDLNETPPTAYEVHARPLSSASTAARILGVKWELNIRGVGTTQAEHDHEVEDMVRDYLDCMDGNPNADITIHWYPSGPTTTHRVEANHE
jgi:hypothetical protein